MVNSKLTRLRWYLIFLFIGITNELACGQSVENLVQKAEELRAAGDHKNALIQLEKAVKKSAIFIGKRRYYYAATLAYCAREYVEIGQPKRALLMMLKSVNLCESIFGKDHSFYAKSLTSLAGTYSELGQQQKALPIALDALRIIEKTSGKLNQEYRYALTILSHIYNLNDEYEKALSVILEALEISEKISGKENVDYIFTLRTLARVYRGMGKYENAILTYNNIIDISKRTEGSQIFYIDALSDLGLIFTLTGEYNKALQINLQALELSKKNQSSQLYSNCIANLSILYEHTGQYDKALPLYKESLAIAEKNYGKLHQDYIAALGNISQFFWKTGQIEEALSFANQAYELTKNNLGIENETYSTLLNNLALIYQNMGQEDNALPMLKEALALDLKILGKLHPKYAGTLNNLGGYYYRCGQYNEALPFLLEAADIVRKNDTWDLQGVMVLNNLALLQIDMQHNTEAFSLIIDAMDIILTKIIPYSRLLSEKEQANYLSLSFHLYDFYPSYFCKNYSQKDSVAPFAYNLELCTKGIILGNTSQILQFINSSGDSTLKDLYEQYLILRNIIAKQYSLPIVERRTDLTELGNKADKMEVELSQKSAPFKEAIDERSIKWGQVNHQLKMDEAAIEFSSFQYRDKKWTDSIFYCAYLVRHNDTLPQLVYLFEQRKLDSLLSKIDYAACYGDLECVKAKINRFHDWNGNGQKIYQLIWSKIEPYLKGINTVYYSPSGKLHKINLGALPVSDKAVLADKYKLVQLNSTRSVALPSFKPIYVYDTTSVALFGGIYYDTDTTALKNSVASYHANATSDPWLFASRGFETDSSQRGGSWRYLPGTLDEVQSVKPMFSRSNVYTGLEATEETFKTLPGKSSPDILHLATHGFFFKEQNTKDRDGKINSFQSSNDPLIRSGLMMAGGNIKWSGGELPHYMEDGILTAKEVAAMNLYNTKLVVLSACETGLGDVKGSEGVYGLQRAFKAAGVKYLLMSLWSVPDRATAAFMKSFYVELKNGKDIQTAFDNTQKHMRQQYSEPFYWAGFVLVR